MFEVVQFFFVRACTAGASRKKFMFIRLMWWNNVCGRDGFVKKLKFYAKENSMNFVVIFLVQRTVFSLAFHWENRFPFSI